MLERHGDREQRCVKRGCGPSVLLTAARVLVRSAIDGPAVNAIRQIRVIPDHTREL